MGKTQVAEQQVSNGRTLKKVSATQIKLADKPAGYEFEGTFIGLKIIERMNEEGELKPLHTLVIEDLKGNRVKMLADAGLRTALSDAMIVEGDYFKAVKGEKIKLDGVRTMNTWDIFQYADA